MDFVETLWLFITTRWLLSLGIALLVLITIYLIYQFIDSLRWLHFKMNFPFFGTIAKESSYDPGTYPGFRSSEANICAKYATHIKGCWGEEHFNRYRQYISLAGDSKQKPTPFFMWIVLAILVTAESLGFSYMLGKWMAMEASENTHVLLMFAIVTVICIVMVILTHEAGKEWYCARKINYYIKLKKENQDKNLNVGKVDLAEQQDKDKLTEDGKNNNPDYQRALNRIDREQQSSFMRWVTFIAIVVIATTSTWMRYNAMERDLTNETTLQQGESASSADPFAMVLPDEITEPQQAADNKAFLEIQSATRQEGIAAFVMLAFIFIITQIVGIVVGRKSAFVGRESFAAYEQVLDYPDFNSYKNKALAIKYAQASLTKWRSLQAKKAIDGLNFQTSKSFVDYLDYDKGIKIAPNQTEKPQETSATPNVEVAHHTPQIVEETPPALKSQEEEKPAVLPSPQTIDNAPNNDNVPSFEEIKAHLELLNDRDKEIVYYRNLPESAKTDELKAFLKERKDAREEAELF